MVELKDFLKPEKSVLVVWDVQEALVNAIFNREEFLKNLRIIIEKARSKSIPIFYTKITPLPEKFESQARKLFYSGVFNPGDIVQEIKPQQGDFILNKNTASIFVGTNFEYMIRNASIQTIFFTGIATEIGIETSARQAMSIGFLPVIVEDAVSSGDKEAHERSLANMRKMMTVMRSQEIMRIWDST
ncbi:MAG: isochorismatase family cysteine hydrolase [Thermoplasmata archaeon]